MTAPDREDELVRSLFQDLKREDARALSSYDMVLKRAGPRRPRLRPSPVLALAAAGVVIAAATVTYRAGVARDSPFVVPPDVAALAAWHPATDVLMPEPAMLVDAAATLSSSILNLNPLTRGSIP